MNGEWKPIETAPKDGTEIIAYCSDSMGGFISVALCILIDMRLTWVRHGRYVCNPTHWMPLPPPPQATA